MGGLKLTAYEHASISPQQGDQMFFLAKIAQLLLKSFPKM
jgi:hypothetical protein